MLHSPVCKFVPAKNKNCGVTKFYKNGSPSTSTQKGNFGNTAKRKACQKIGILRKNSTRMGTIQKKTNRRKIEAGGLLY
jgi:hypothetical protein